MIYINIFIIIMTILKCYKIGIYFLRKDILLSKKIFELIIFILMILLNYYNLVINKKNIYIIVLLFILGIYTLISFIYENILKKEYVSILSVKNGIDLSESGILFLSKDEIILINNLFYNVLKYFDINEKYIDNLKSKCFEKILNDYLLKYDDKVYMLKIYDDNMILLLDINELYLLEKKEEKQNKLIMENNLKLIETLKNIETLEKEKNLLKMKNKYHDIIGFRLALFSKYLEKEDKSIESLPFLFDSIYEDFDNKLSSNLKLNNLIKMYKIIGINITIKGNFPSNEEKENIFFEIIREAITNAIIHADSKNINIVINDNQMTITNDGKMPKPIIFEGEGIKGMREKISKIGGSIKICTNELFTLVINI